jgi:hypothetical protein
MTTDERKKLVAAATPGRRVQFHGYYYKEADGTDHSTWDSSHETSVILPDGSRYRGYAWHKHAADASLDALAPDLAGEVIALREAAGVLAGCVDALLKLDANLGTRSTVHDATARTLTTLRAVLGESE